MNALTLGGSAIRQLDGLYSLNDLHAAAGGAEKHQPNRFLRLAQTKALAAEIEQTPDLALAIKSVRGGANPGSYVCRELVYAYAMWISPAFNLKVIRAFDAAQAAPALTRETQDWLDRVDQLGGCWASVADLLAGGEPDTAKLADLLGFLSREYTAARDGLHAALLADIESRD